MRARRRQRKAPSGNHQHNYRRYRPEVECLEDRLPPGDLFGLLPAAPSGFDTPLDYSGAWPDLVTPTTAIAVLPPPPPPALLPPALVGVTEVATPTLSSSPGESYSAAEPFAPLGGLDVGLLAQAVNGAATSPSFEVLSSASSTTWAAVFSASSAPPPPAFPATLDAAGQPSPPPAPMPSGGQAEQQALNLYAGQFFAAAGVTITGIAEAIDGRTRSDTPTFTGTGPAGATLRLAIDGQALATFAVADDGQWSYQVADALAEGTHIVDVSVVVTGPGPRYEPARYEFTIDQTPPALEILSPEFTHKADPWVVVRVDADDLIVPEAVVYLDVDWNQDGDFDDGDEYGFAEGFVTFDDAGVQVGMAQLAGLTEGYFPIRARLHDMLGNEGTSPVFTIQVDPYAGKIGSLALRQLMEAYQEAYANLNIEHTTIYVDETTFETVEVVTGGEHGEVAVPDSFYDAYRRAFIFDAENRVQIYARVTLAKHLASFRNDLAALGMEVVTTAAAQNLVVGFIPVGKLPELEKVAHLSTAFQVDPWMTRAGSVANQGDTVIAADVFRSQTGFNGGGITVGVISDSVDQAGGGLAASIATGDLPAAGVNVLKDGPAGSSDEGRAMLEIIHDIAPGAGLAFYTGVFSPQDFANGIIALANAGARVIIDDIGWSNSPFFNDGVIAQAVDQVTAAGVFYVSAAGNDANIGYQAAWSGTSATVGGTTGTFHQFAPGDVLQDFTLAAGETLQIIFQWDAAFLEGGSAQANFQVNNNVDVLITDSTGANIIQRFDNGNPSTDQASEFVTFSQAGSFALAFQLVSGSAPTQVRWVSFGSDNPQAQGQGAATIFGQPAAKGAMAVGAVPFSNPTQPEPFTSQGGFLDFLFDANGNRLFTADRRFKPEVAAPDGVSTTVSGFSPFFGTSAAAPQAAGAAALVLSQKPGAKPAQLKRHFQRTAIDVHIAGPDDLTGAGLIQVKTFVGEGDRFEPNDSSDVATDFGSISGTLTLDELSIHDNEIADDDWYRFTTTRNGQVTITVDIKGPADDLDLRVFTLNEVNTLIQLVASTDHSGGRQEEVVFTALAGQPILVWVFGYNRSLGDYILTIEAP